MAALVRLVVFTVVGLAILIAVFVQGDREDRKYGKWK